MDREGGSGDGYHSDHGFPDATLRDHREDANSSGASTPRGDSTTHGEFSQVEEQLSGKQVRNHDDEVKGKPTIQKMLSSKAEEWIAKKGLSWPWKGTEQEGGSEARAGHFAWPWLQNDQEAEPANHKSCSPSGRPEMQQNDGHRAANNEASGSWSSFNVNSTSSASSCGSTSSSAVNKVDSETDCLDFEILWEDLTIGEQIGQGM